MRNLLLTRAGWVLGTALATAAPALAQDTPPAPTPPVPAPAAPAATAAPAAPPPNYKIQVSGLIDGYFAYQFNNPKNNSTALPTNVYAVRQTSPALSLAELNVFQNARPQGFGFKATLMTGDTADINHGGVIGATSGEARIKNVQQLYGTYSFGADGSGVDVGKFYTPFGYEVTESNANYNYTRSYVYAAEPFYHSGLRIYTPVPGLAALTATFYLTRALNSTANEGLQDANKDPAYIGQLNYTDPKSKFTAISTFGYGKDGGRGARFKDTINDNDFTYNLNANINIGLNYAYLKTEPDNGAKTTTNGYAVYYHQQVTPKTAGALRFSGLDSKTDGAGHFRPYEITATYEYKATPTFLTRLEYRHDHANTPIYAGSDGNFTKSNQDEVIASGVFTFGP